MTTRKTPIERAEAAVVIAAMRLERDYRTGKEIDEPWHEFRKACRLLACARLLKASSVKIPSKTKRPSKTTKTAKATHRHKWSEWEYGGSFEDGYTRICAKCRKVQVR